MKKWLVRLSKIELVLIYLVIIAGSVVRMTGSGMGCPDWPKCFGYLIPPTERSQLEWEPGREFAKGQIIIKNEALLVAQSDFTATDSFEKGNWETYTKHNYALFNPFHTWTEYINRLVGALSGIPMLLMVVLSLFYIRKNWRYFLLSLAGLFMLGFEAWLGKLVVDGNLIPGSITIHMMGALVIVAILVVFRGLLTEDRFAPVRIISKYRGLLILAMVFTLIQIALGTQVREQVDYLHAAGVARTDWVTNLDWEFYVHRSFSIIILAVNAWLWHTNRKYGLGFREFNWVMGLILVEILLGVFLNYLGMPQFAQPAHLLLGALLFGFQFFAVVRLALSEKTRVVPVG